MFRIDQIITSSQFIRHFRELAKHLADRSEPILIAQEMGNFLW